MVSLGSLIPPNLHQHIQHVEIMTLKESTLNAPLPQSLSLASINEIIIEPCDLWYKKLHEYLKWNALPPNLSFGKKMDIKVKGLPLCYFRRSHLQMVI